MTLTSAKETARRARAAAKALSHTTSEARTRALEAMAAHIERASLAIVAANQQDLAAATRANLAPAMIDRLRLDNGRVGNLVATVRQVAAAPDPLGQVVRQWTRPNGLQIRKVRIPLGVIAIVYESRPNVTSDAAALCIRSGNAAILRGGSEAIETNRALMSAIATGLTEAKFPPDSVALIASQERAELQALLQCSAEIDLVIPRGGEGLIGFVTEHATMPVIQHFRGNCHIFVERTADFDQAVAICINAKASRPGVCNAMETLLVDAAIAEQFLPLIAAAFAGAQVEVRADARARAICPAWLPASEADFYAEFLDLICAVAVVDDLAAAIRHIEHYSSSHTEAILTQSESAAEQFVSQINSSTVMVNASTRFADGGELGLGAEIGISTTRLHAYGPMGAEELTATKFVVTGQGQVRI